MFLNSLFLFSPVTYETGGSTPELMYSSHLAFKLGEISLNIFLFK